MALLRTKRCIDNDVYKITFINDPEYLSEGDKKLMRKFGEPEIDLGGVFLEDTGNEYELPEKKAKIRADFPYTAEFDSRDADFEDNTLTKVLAYETEIVARFTTALEDLRDNTDTFTAEKTYNI